uniref:hydantoinase B/oxoprolinase family protein n=1 Tax=Agrobacterium fabrum TaxID=1176649 RepID=UPI0021BD3BFD|nr:hydantoinase B/oxoprolinase family protein [Agrobacterium fabrum]
MNAAIPDALAAAGPGMSGIIVVTGRDRLHGGKRVSVINPICGGGGGRIGQDGIDGIDNRSGSLLTVPRGNCRSRNDHARAALWSARRQSGAGTLAQWRGRCS